MTNRQWLLEQMQNMSDEELADGIYESEIITNAVGCNNERKL